MPSAMKWSGPGVGVGVGWGVATGVGVAARVGIGVGWGVAMGVGVAAGLGVLVGDGVGVGWGVVVGGGTAVGVATEIGALIPGSKVSQILTWTCPLATPWVIPVNSADPTPCWFSTGSQSPSPRASSSSAVKATL